MAAEISPGWMVAICVYVVLATGAATIGTTWFFEDFKESHYPLMPAWQLPWVRNPLLAFATWLVMLVLAHTLLPAVAVACIYRFVWRLYNNRPSARQRRYQQAAEARAQQDLERQQGRDPNGLSVVQELREYAASFDPPPRRSRQDPPPALSHEEVVAPTPSDGMAAPAVSPEPGLTSFDLDDGSPAHLPTVQEECEEEGSVRGSKGKEASRGKTQISRPAPAVLRGVVVERS
ncbi:hypothetical protein Micbo1qcDRAFT_236042 [Microdochium bolleyi]|uniref:Uncharacterized protein n=1 Tax=Microdochium bolleyi TaxID=196109 RepID=A0A136ITD5_9PEZI|nr:hypothetical protein Micbo1qcDRAFT_236042 [Microdochium bolleyi]